MAYQSFPYLGFGKGLNLRDKPDAVDPQECIDCLNVDFSERGAIQTRAGYDTIVASAIKGLGAFKTTGGTKRLLTTVGSNLAAYNLTGGSATHTSSLTDSTTPMSFVAYGTPASERVYAGNGTDVRYYDGSGFTNPNASSVVVPKASAFCLQATDNRLVATGFSAGNNGPAGATVNPSHVYFSDPGDPATWGANNYVQLTPGDGEKIVGAITWRELVIVFKQTKFFVFYGNSVDADGNPIFNYRPVEGGAGAVSRLGIAATPDGVYFVGSDGIYVTTGSSATKVSDLVEPLWTREAADYFSGGVINDVTQCSLTATDDRVYMAFPTSLGQRVLVFDKAQAWFSIYNLPAKYLLNFDGSIWFADTFLGKHNNTYDDDDGAAIFARWRSGWDDFGSPDIKVLRASKGWGAGLINVSISKDFAQGQVTNELLDFGAPKDTQPQWNSSTWGGTTWAEESDLLEPEQRRQAVRGTAFSTTFSGSGKWALHRMTHQIRQVRQPGIEES